MSEEQPNTATQANAAATPQAQDSDAQSVLSQDSVAEEQEQEPQKAEERKPWYKRLWDWSKKKKQPKQPVEQVPTPTPSSQQPSQEEPKTAYLGALKNIEIDGAEVKDKDEIRKYIEQSVVKNTAGKNVTLTQIDRSNIQGKKISMHGENFKDEISFDVSGKVTKVEFGTDSTYIGQAELMLEANHNNPGEQIDLNKIKAAFEKDQAARDKYKLPKHNVRFEEFVAKHNAKLAQKFPAVVQGPAAAQEEQHEETTRTTPTLSPIADTLSSTIQPKTEAEAPKVTGSHHTTSPIAVTTIQATPLQQEPNTRTPPLQRSNSTGTQADVRDHTPKKPTQTPSRPRAMSVGDKPSQPFKR